MSSEVTLITDIFMKKGLQQVIPMGCLTFLLSHPEKSVSSNTNLEIFDPDHQAKIKVLSKLDMSQN